jgi:hypothetical protein
MLPNILAKTSVHFLILIPFFSAIFSILLILFIRKDSYLLRSQYQNRLMLLIGSALIINILGQAGYLGTPITIPTTDGKNSTLDVHLISTVFIPVLIFALCTRYAAKRLMGMGYNRFNSLFAAIPVIGPCFLFWLALTIDERTSTKADDVSNVRNL